jgi:hypothetical protein
VSPDASSAGSGGREPVAGSVLFQWDVLQVRWRGRITAKPANSLPALRRAELHVMTSPTAAVRADIASLGAARHGMIPVRSTACATDQRPDHHAELQRAALDAGYDAYTANRIFGETPEEYAAALVETGRLPRASFEGGRRHGWLKRTSGSGPDVVTYSGLWRNGVPVGRHSTR